MTFMNGLARFFVCPAIVWIADALMPGLVQYANLGQVLAVGWTLAVVSIIADLTVLPAIGTAMGAAFLDAGMGAAIVYFSQFFMMRSTVTWWGAILTGVLLGLSELAMHAWIGATKEMRRA